MEGLSQQVSSLSMTELRAELGKFNEFVNIPNAPSARRVLERKLVAHMAMGGDASSCKLDHSPDSAEGKSVDTCIGTTEKHLNTKNCIPGIGTPVVFPTEVQARADAMQSETKKNSFCDKKPDILSEAISSSGDGNTPVSSRLSTTPTVFYGVCVPVQTNNVSVDEVDGLKVFTDKIDALKAAKKIKGSRFKAFTSRSDAEEFAQRSLDQLVQSPLSDISNVSPVKIPSKAVPSESLPYSSPKTQDLVQLRRAIEQNNADKFKDLVWNNPRYLVSSGDTPTILQEGFRYNGMHSAAMKNKPQMAQLLLNTLEDPSFLGKLYVNDDVTTRDKRINFLVDLYINTPDKGFNETPLHFACKFGCLDVVKILGSHPLINKKAVNRDGLTAAEIVCSRKTDASEDLKENILLQLEDQFYIPLWRSDDNTTQPMIGEPWSPTENCPGLNIGHTLTSPLKSRSNEVPMSVKAFAGPMSPCKATEFRKNWSTPPKGSNVSARKSFHDIKRQDGDKGLERIGRELARTLNAPWTEHWPFLGCCIDISSIDGLEKFDKYLEDQRKKITDGDWCDGNNTYESCNLPTNKTPESAQRTDDNKSFRTPSSVDRKLDDVINALSALRIYSPGGEQSVDGSPQFGIVSPVGKESSDEGTPVRNESKLQGSISNVTLTDEVSKKSSGELKPYYSLEFIVPALSPALRRVRNAFTGLWSKEMPNKLVRNRTPTGIGHDIDTTDGRLHTPQKKCIERKLPVFINGLQPCKMDVDVFRALERVNVPETFTNVLHWRSLVAMCSDDERKSWRTPVRSITRSANVLRRSKLTVDRTTNLQTNLLKEFSLAE